MYIDDVLEEARAQAGNVQKRLGDVDTKLTEQKAALEALKAAETPDTDAIAVAEALQKRLETKQGEIRKESEAVSY
jgi:hypothetical protein